MVECILNDLVARTGKAKHPDDANDVDEFSNVPIGQAIRFDELGRDLSAARQILELEFGALEADRTYYQNFADFIDKLELRHFEPHEFLVLGASNRNAPFDKKNGLPPKSLWDNIINSALIIDEVRDRLKAPIDIHSCYRNPAYNRYVGGKTGSMHLTFNAIDWSCRVGTAADWHRVAKEVRHSNSRFLGGVGRYNSFIHIDTRGNEANW